MLKIVIEVPEALNMEVLALIQRIAQGAALAELADADAALEILADEAPGTLSRSKPEPEEDLTAGLDVITPDADELAAEEEELLIDDDEAFDDDELLDQPDPDAAFDEEDDADEVLADDADDETFDDEEDEGTYTRADMEGMRVQQIRDICSANDIDVTGLTKKQILDKLFAE